MQNRLISSVLIISMVIPVVACNNSSYQYEEFSTDEIDETDYQEKTYETTYEPEPDVIFDAIDDYRIIEPFYEGYAWICYKESDTDTYCTQLVDVDGFSHFTIDDYPSEVYPVVDNVTWIRFNNSYESEWFENSTEWIIDTNGNITYKTSQSNDNSSSNREHIYGYGNGRFLVLKFKNGINGETYSIGTIDKYGKVIDDFWEAPWLNLNFQKKKAEHLQDNYFRIGDCVYDITTHTCIMMPTSETDIDKYGKNSYNGYYFYPNYTVQFTNTTNYTKNDNDANADTYIKEGILKPKTIIFDEPSKKTAEDLEGPNPVLTGNRYFRHGFYDCEGNRFLSIEKYPDCEMWCSDFNSDGYSLMIVRGKDLYYYITVIDKQGVEQFEPFRIIYECNYYFHDMCNFSPYIVNGMFICQTEVGVCLYDIKGNRIEILVDNSVDMSDPLSSDYKPLLLYAFGDGYAIIDTSLEEDMYDYEYYFF